jgi:phage/plasmid-like protein (TIGR03299 family)
MHLIDNSLGFNAMAYTGATPWHGLGQSLDPSADISTWTKSAGLDWTAEKSDISWNTPEGIFSDSDTKVLYRSDTKKMLSTVSKGYKVVQPSEVMSFFAALVDSNNVQMHTAGCLSGGKKIWALAKINEGSEIVPGDIVQPYLLLATSFDGTLATVARFTSIRVVCNNTLTISSSEEALSNPAGNTYKSVVRIPHSAIFDAKTVRLDMGLALDSFEKFLLNCRKQANNKLNAADAKDLTVELLKSPVEQDTDAILESRGYKKIMSLFQKDSKGNSLVGDSTWGWLNAVTEYVDWHKGYGADSRMKSAWFGTGEQLKNKAAELIA